MNNLSASVLNTEDGKAKYDQAMLKILSDKQVLAWILKRFVSEYEHLPLEEIETEYIEPETILVSKAGVDRDSPVIKGLSEKDSSQKEGTVYYDIVFQAYYPGKDRALYQSGSTGRLLSRLSVGNERNLLRSKETDFSVETDQ